MNPADREAYRARYVDRLKRYGHDPRTLGWAAGKQAERFTSLTELLPIARMRSVLDVGCGFGDLYDFLRRGGFTGQYTGIDFIPELIETGRAAYPEADLRVGDVAEFAPGERFDIVIASGIFNAKLAHDDQWTHVTSTLERMFDLCTVAAGADFLTSYCDFEREDLFYCPPERVFGFAKSLTRRVGLLHHYMPFEFAIVLFKDDDVREGARFAPLG